MILNDIDKVIKITDNITSIILVIPVFIILLLLGYFYSQRVEKFTFQSLNPIIDNKSAFVFYPKGLKGKVPLQYENSYKADYIDEMYVLREKTEPKRLKLSIINQGPIPQNSKSPANFYEF